MSGAGFIVGVGVNVPSLKRMLDDFGQEGFRILHQRAQQSRGMTPQIMQERAREDLERMRKQQKLEKEVFDQYNSLFALKDCHTTVLAYKGQQDMEKDRSSEVWGVMRGQSPPGIPAG